MTVVTRRFRLRGVHFLYDPNHAEPKHGHEYFLEVSVMASAGDRLEKTVREQVLSFWDKKDWNKNLNQASGELLVEEFDRLLRASELKPDLVAVVLRETRKNRFVSALSRLACCE